MYRSSDTARSDAALIRLRRTGFVILAMMFIAATGIAIRGRGPWYDEFYTFYLVRPNATVDQLWPAWLRDNHPPLFYALAWAWSRFLAQIGLSGALTNTVEGLRTINLVILAGVATMIARLARGNPEFARIVWYECLVLAATLPALDQIDQLRSYFLSFALTALFLIMLLRHFAGQPGWRATASLGIVLALVSSVHLVTTVIAGALFSAAIAQRLLAKSWHDARRLILTGALAIVPFALMMAVQLPAILGNTKIFWIPPGFNAGRWALETELTGATFANPVVAVIGLAGLIALVFRARQGDTAARGTLTFVATLAGGLSLAMVVLMVAHLSRPLLITRYLVALDPVVALIMALCAAAETRRLPVRIVAVLDALALAAAGWAIHANYATTVARPSWDGTGSAIAAIVRSCPQTIVHPDMRWNTMPLDMPPRDNREVVPFSYDFVAHRFGFVLAPAGSRIMSLDCQTVFWTEHVAGQHLAAQTVLDGLRRSGYPVRSGRIRRIGNGWIFVSPPSAPVTRF